MQKLSLLLKRDYTRNFLKLFSGMLLAQGLSLALSPLLSRLYTPEDFGLVALYMAIAGLLSMVTTLKYEQAIMLPARQEHAAALMVLVTGLTIAFSVLITLVLLLFNKQITGMFSQPAIGFWLWFLPLSMLLHGLFQAFNYWANRTKYFGTMATTNLLQHVILNVSRIILGWQAVPFNGLIISQVMAPVVPLFYMAAKIYPRIREIVLSVRWYDIKQQAMAYSQYPRYNLLQSLSNNLASSLPIFLFTSGFSAHTAGLYAFGYTFVFRPLSLFSQSTLQVLSQKIIEDYNNNIYIYPSIKKLVWQLFRFGIIPFILLGIFAPLIFEVVFSPVWKDAGRMIQILLPWLFMVYLTSPLSFVPELFFKQKKSMVLDFISIVLRAAALYAGIYAERVYLSVALFSIVSFGVVAYALIWYLQLARNQKRTNFTD